MQGRPRRTAGLVGLIAAAGLLCSTAAASSSWAASPAGVAASTPGAAARLPTAEEASKPPATILADAKRATERARTVHIVGSISQQGSSVSFNIVDGHKSGGGSLTYNGSSFDIIVHRSKVYLKAGKATWTKLANATAAALLANRWLETTTANKDFGPLAKLADINSLVSQFSPSGRLKKGATATFAGQPAVPLTDTGGGNATLYVAAKGTPYILGLSGTKSQPGTVRFSSYNTAKVPAAPKGAINLDELEAGASGGSGSATSATTTTLPGGL